MANHTFQFTSRSAPKLKVNVGLLEIGGDFVSEPLKNATYLFELPGRRYHSSESWWTSFFSMLLLYRSRNDPQWALPTYACRNGYPVESVPFALGDLALRI